MGRTLIAGIYYGPIGAAGGMMELEGAGVEETLLLGLRDDEVFLREA